ncbi:MAG: Rieske (2Fe-2S) protein [Chromatiales bacterium]|nr:Rieske (2Fe-2S) protein [Chromatiales bacterium]
MRSVRGIRLTPGWIHFARYRITIGGKSRRVHRSPGGSDEGRADRLGAGLQELSEEMAAMQTPLAQHIDVIDLDKLPLGRIVKSGPFMRSVLVYRDQDGVRAYKAYCSHQGMELMASGIRGSAVTCALHGWRFDMPEGACFMNERWPLTELPVGIVDGRVRVWWRE